MAVLGQGAILFGVTVGLNSGFWWRFSIIVRLIVEFFEEEEEHDCVHTDPPDKCSWIVAVYEEELECMDHNAHKLNLKVMTII